MPQVEKEVKVYKAHYICDECKIGTMIYTGFAFTTNPPQYPHDCSHCKKRVNFPVAYPTIIHKVVPEILNIRSIRQMPLFDFECEQCKEISEHYTPVFTLDFLKCKCGGISKRIEKIYPSTLSFQGSGFYKTDYK